MTQVINEDTRRLAIACDYCGDVIEDSVQVIDYEGEELCTKCADQVKIMTLVKRVTEAAIRINFETKFGASVVLYANKTGVDVTLKDADGEAVAVSRVSFQLKHHDPIADLEAIWITLANVALYRKLPEGFKRSQFGYLPEVMSA